MKEKIIVAIEENILINDAKKKGGGSKKGGKRPGYLRNELDQALTQAAYDYIEHVWRMRQAHELQRDALEQVSLF